MFRTSFARHRCLIPASGFYEWKTVAGLLAAWKAPDGQTIVSTCIITTGPNEVMAPIHDRMPVILAPDQFNAWLDPAMPGPLEMLRPCNPEGMAAYPVRPLRTDGPECIAPVK